MKYAIACAVALLVAAPRVDAANRLTDKEVEALIDRIDDARDRFEDALPRDLKHSIMRGPTGEVDVDKFLDDFEDNIDRLEDRFKPGYSASNEAAVVLRQAAAIEGHFRGQAPGTKGESEWNRLAAYMKQLAQAYGTDFPLPDNASVRRIGDRELASAADTVAKSAGALKHALNQDLKGAPSVDATARNDIARTVDQLSSDAKLLKDRVRGGKPSSAEAAKLLATASRLSGLMQGRTLPTASAAWSGMGSHFADIAQAYGEPWPAH